jgi:hypothetical protein
MQSRYDAFGQMRYRGYNVIDTKVHYGAEFMGPVEIVSGLVFMG